MISTRAWIIILALVCFGAGLASGLTGAELSRKPMPAPSAFGDFERAFVAEFDLDHEHQLLLVGLLDHYNREIEEIENRYTAEIRREMEPELKRSGLLYRRLLRDRLLPPAQRAEFDRRMADYQDNL